MSKTLLLTISTILVLTGCTNTTPLFSPSPYSGPRVRDGSGMPYRNNPQINNPRINNTLPAGQPLSQPLTSSEVIPNNPLNNNGVGNPPVNNNGAPIFATPTPGAYIPNTAPETSIPTKTSTTNTQTSSYIPPSTQTPNTDTAAAPAATTSSSGSAVQTLLNDAKQAAANNQLDKAAGSLERAVRLEPRNASIWYDLAQVRLHQGQYTKAETLAQKSIGFSGGNSALIKKNWNLISLSKQAQGDTAGAEAAKKKAL